MRLLTFASGLGSRVGRLDSDDRVHDLSPLLPAGSAGDLASIVASWDELADRVGNSPAPGRALADIQLLAPIPRPRRNIFCVGKNYLEHVDEFRRSGYDVSSRDPSGLPPRRPVVFTKASTSVIGPGARIERHAEVTSELDYEAELAVIIGRAGRDIRAADAPSHVWGYTIVNDITARDRQRDHVQWFLGKSLDTFCPMGPYAVTADEVDPGNLTVECRVNGEARQKASTADMIFDIPTLIETISAGLTLEPGDVIATGTPAGVGVGFRPPRFLESGDVIEVTITGLGTLVNPVG